MGEANDKNMLLSLLETLIRINQDSSKDMSELKTYNQKLLSAIESQTKAIEKLSESIDKMIISKEEEVENCKACAKTAIEKAKEAVDKTNEWLWKTLIWIAITLSGSAGIITIAEKLKTLPIK